MTKTIREYNEALLRLIRASLKTRQSEAATQGLMDAEEHFRKVLADMHPDDLKTLETKLAKTS